MAIGADPCAAVRATSIGAGAGVIAPLGAGLPSLSSVSVLLASGYEYEDRRQAVSEIHALGLDLLRRQPPS